jgi:predicted kinase
MRGRVELVEIDNEPASLAFLVTGVPGAGKTTVCRELGRRFEQAAHIPTDALAGLVVAGRTPPRPPLEEERPGESVEGGEEDRQLLLRARNAALLCDSFFTAGFTPIVDDVVVRRLQLDHYLEHVRSRPLALVVLAPPRAVVLERDSGREPHKRGLAAEWEFLEATLRAELADVGLWFDSAGQTPAETVDAILAAVAAEPERGGRIYRGQG